MDPAEGQSKVTSYAASFSVVCVLLCREKCGQADVYDQHLKSAELHTNPIHATELLMDADSPL